MSSQLSQVNQTQTLSNKITSTEVVYSFILNNFNYNAFMINDDIQTADESILNFIINELLYKNYSTSFRNRIYMTASYLIKRGFKHQFILKMKTDINFNCVAINDLFKFIKTDGKSKVPFFDKPTFDDEILTPHNCCICLEDYEESNKNFISCHNCKNLKTCIPCFNQLNPVKCVQCRTTQFFNINLNTVDNTIKFKYNKKIISHTITNNHYTNYDDILLIYLEVINKNNYEIRIINLNFKSEMDLKRDFYEIIKDNLFYFSNGVIIDNMIPIYEDIITEEIINLIKETENNKSLFKLLNINYDHFEGDCDKLDNLFNYCINVDGYESVLNYEFMSTSYFELDGETLNLICDNNIDEICKNADDFTIEL
jgi:hypothetical protein